MTAKGTWNVGLWKIGPYDGYYDCCNPSLGLTTKARACKVAGQEETLEWRKVWGNEPSHSQRNSHFGELKSQWTPEFLENNCRGWNPSDWKKNYIIGKLLKHRCLKWVRITHLDISNTSYGQKKGWESNWQFDSWPLKVKNRPIFVVFKWRATYPWKALDKGYNFASNFTSIGDLHTKLWAPKVAGVPVVGILGLPLGSFETKCHLDVGLMKRHKVYYKGEGDGFPQVRVMMSLVSSSLPVVRPSTKSAPTMP
jgi:hypothetical protein